MKTIIGYGAAVWGVMGAVCLLTYAVVGLMPLVINAFRYPWQWYHWVVLAGHLGFMAYAEGYRGFQKSFSPRVAARARYLAQHPRLQHVLLAPLFCMGYVYATWRLRLRILILTTFIVLLVMLVSRLNQPWRGIIDAGVVIGLLWGVVSLCALSIQALTTEHFNYDAELPETVSQHTTSVAPDEDR
ncbi:MAG: hypothetical protein O7G88_11850 [bacterium]|nr:hypothetical protein [bacterium]